MNSYDKDAMEDSKHDIHPAASNKFEKTGKKNRDVSISKSRELASPMQSKAAGGQEPCKESSGSQGRETGSMPNP